MKKKMGRRILSFVLSLMMVFTALFVGSMEVKADEKSVVWKDAEMEDFWNGGAWSHNITDWNVGNLTTYAYSTNSNGVDISNFSSTESALNFSSSLDNNEIILSQTVATMPAGTYTLTAPVMGNNTQVKLFYKVNGSTTDVNSQQWLSGWDNWDNLTGTFTITQDLSNVEIGISLVCHNGGWGYLDSIKLTSSDVTVLSAEPTADPVYTMTVSADKTSVETGGSIVLTATVKEDGTEISTLPTGLTIAFYPDGNGTGKTNATYSQAKASFTDTVTLKEEGDFYFVAKLYDANWNSLAEAYITLTATGESTAPVYTVEATVDKTSVNQNDTVKLTAVVKKDGVVVPQDQLDDEGLQLWWWADKWQDAHTDGLVDAKFANYDENSGYSLTADATLPSAGTYYILAELRETAPSETVKGAWVTEAVVKITTQASTGEGTPSSESDDTETEDTETEEVVNIELVNADFSTSPTGTWTGEVTSGWIEGNSMDVVSYSTDAWLQLPSYVGTTGLKFSMNHGETMTISQWLTELPAGTYTITAPVMGENTDIYLVLGDQEIKATSLSGYNNWSKAKATFTITEDMTDVKVGFKLVAKSSGSNYSWGWIDSISLVKGVPATGDTTNVMGFVALMVTGAALVAYTSVKRRKINF